MDYFIVDQTGVILATGGSPEDAWEAYYAEYGMDDGATGLESMSERLWEATFGSDLKTALRRLLDTHCTDVILGGLAQLLTEASAKADEDDDPELAAALAGEASHVLAAADAITAS